MVKIRFLRVKVGKTLCGQGFLIMEVGFLIAKVRFLIIKVGF